MSQIRLKIYRSAVEFRTETFRQSRVTVGRDINNDICIPEKDVSRFHSMFDCADEGWQIVDLESTNGTFLNGICVKKSQLKSGDVIVVGNARLHVMECPTSIEVAPASAGNYRLLQTFDARGMVGATDSAPVPLASAGRKRARRGDPTPVPGVPKAQAPILTAEEILQGAKDPRSTARLLARWLYPMIDADAVVVYLCDPETQAFDKAAVEPAKKIISAPGDVLDYVREHRITVHAQVDKEAGGKGGPVQAVMCAPILDKRRLLGAMALVRREVPWKLGDPDLESVAVAALAAGSALGCAQAYGRLERAYLALLEANESLPVSVGESLQAEAEALVLESMTERLRAALARIAERGRPLAAERSEDEAVHSTLDEILGAARESDQIAERMLRLARQRREPAGETWPIELLAQLLPVLREVGGAAMTIDDNVASELPPVAVSPRIVAGALARIVVFCRDRMAANRLKLTVEMHGFETPLQVLGQDDVAPGYYVHVAIESEGDPTAFEDLEPLCDEEAEAPRDLRDPVVGLYWAARTLRRAAGRLIVRSEGDRGVGFDLYLPVLT